MALFRFWVNFLSPSQKFRSGIAISQTRRLHKFTPERTFVLSHHFSCTIDNIKGERHREREGTKTEKTISKSKQVRQPTTPPPFPNNISPNTHYRL